MTNRVVSHMPIAGNVSSTENSCSSRLHRPALRHRRGSLHVSIGLYYNPDAIAIRMLIQQEPDEESRGRKEKKEPLHRLMRVTNVTRSSPDCITWHSKDTDGYGSQSGNR